VEVVGGQWVLKLAIEVKTVPGSVIKRKVQSEVDHIETTTGRKPGKKERRTLADDARLSLLPVAFSKQSSIMVWINPKDQWMVLDAGSQAKADEVLTSLVKALQGFAVNVVHTQASPAVAMAHWLGSKEAPAGFNVDRECELKASDASKAIVRYTRHPLDTDEVTQHIAAGKVPTRLALTWNDRISFVLTEALALKKLAFLDAVLEEGPLAAGDTSDDHFDADVAIATGELARMLPALIEALGGEATPGSLPLAA
jgi:recombination associated protein RdgC